MSTTNQSVLQRVLCIDDDDEYNFLTQEAFDDVGFEGSLVFKTYADEALDYLASLDEFPDVILLDINLPTMNGWEFLDAYEARGYHQSRATLIFMHSSSVYEEDRARSMGYQQVRGFIDKPITIEGIHNIYKVMSGGN